MAGIRVDRGIEKIEVNDNGEYIEVTLNDPTFFERFGNFLKWLQNKQEELEKKEKVAPVQPEEQTEEVDIDRIIELSKERIEICRESCKALDGLFGEGCCRKVFGDMLPDENCIADFIEQITPILQGMAKKRNEQIELRYNRNRKAAQGKEKRW